MPRYNFVLTSGHFDQLSDHSERTGLSMSEHVRRALDLYFCGQPTALLFVSGNVAASGFSFVGRV